jgi:hypothetical protein
MHIIGILKLPTCFSLQVVYSWGMYCIDAKIVLCTPRKLAHHTRVSEGWGGRDGSAVAADECRSER